jgi:hypothetical protein
MIGALKLGGAVAGAYVVGGKLGMAVLHAVSPTASPDTAIAVQWGSRIASFVVIMAFLK